LLSKAVAIVIFKKEEFYTSLHCEMATTIVL
jgi:hypothetical protein